MVGSLGSSCGTLDFCPALASLVSLVQNINNFLAAHFFTFLVPKGSRDAGSPVSVSLFSVPLPHQEIFR
jgi:hypothetical protein